MLGSASVDWHEGHRLHVWEWPQGNVHWPQHPCGRQEMDSNRQAYLLFITTAPKGLVDLVTLWLLWLCCCRFKASVLSLFSQSIGMDHKGWRINRIKQGQDLCKLYTCYMIVNSWATSYFFEQPHFNLDLIMVPGKLSLRVPVHISVPELQHIWITEQRAKHRAQPGWSPTLSRHGICPWGTATSWSYESKLVLSWLPALNRDQLLYISSGRKDQAWRIDEQD